jgi:uncharacterized protein
MRDELFEWDDLKAAGNLRKHDISFELARLAFDDVLALEDVDDIDAEERIRRIAMANGRLLFIVYTERSPRIRIISARKADRNEELVYFSAAAGTARVKD